MKKVVVIVDIHDEKEKKKALKTVSSLSGIESIAIDMKDKKITVIGDVDPIGVVSKLRKLWHAELLSVGPDKEPEKKKEDEEKKKKEEEEKKKKEEEEKKKNDEKAKDGEVKKDQNEHIQELVKAYHHYNYNPYIMRTPYVVHNPDEYPSSCVIC